MALDPTHIPRTTSLNGAKHPVYEREGKTQDQKIRACLREGKTEDQKKGKERPRIRKFALALRASRNSNGRKLAESRRKEPSPHMVAAKIAFQHDRLRASTWREIRIPDTMSGLSALGH
jgi:hypothetical protein